METDLRVVDKRSHGAGADPQRPVITCAADDGFAKPLGVMLYSALANLRGSTGADVYIVDGGISAANRARIGAITARHGARVTWLRPDFTVVGGLPVSERYPASVYLRLLIPALLPLSIDKAIYLDCDLIVEQDLTELWSCGVAERAILAVQDEGAPTVGSPWGLMNYRELGIDPSRKYFNSGVLLLNLRRWRQQSLARRIIEYIATHPGLMRFGEQDAMNVVLGADWSELDGKWNQLVSPWEGHDKRHYVPGILHFVSRFKPWNPDGAHWTSYIYDRYTRQSGWYSSLGWWRYYLPLLVRRQHVLQERAARAPHPVVRRADMPS